MTRFAIRSLSIEQSAKIHVIRVIRVLKTQNFQITRLIFPKFNVLLQKKMQVEFGMDIKTVNDLEGAIKSERLFEKYDLEKIGVFGSFARGESANDIDFFIDLGKYNFKNLINLKQDLETITQKEVDIMLEKYANPIILHRAKKDMIYVTR